MCHHESYKLKAWLDAQLQLKVTVPQQPLPDVPRAGGATVAVTVAIQPRVHIIHRHHILLLLNILREVLEREELSGVGQDAVLNRDGQARIPRSFIPLKRSVH